MIKNLNLKIVVVYTATATGMIAIINPVAAIAKRGPRPIAEGYLSPIAQSSPTKLLASADADYNFLVTSDWYSCQQLGAEYQEVYAFETASFYINICQKDNVYFYSGEAKQSDQNSIFIPAFPLKNQQGFQAVNGNLSYLVLLPFQESTDLKSSPLKPAEAILTIKRNGQLVAVESSLNKYCNQSETANKRLDENLIAFDNIELESQNSLQIATVSQQQDLGWDLPSIKHNEPLPAEIFQSNSRFDFYQIDGELLRLTTCSNL
ncbi:MAG: hypothetical protein ACRC2S_26070 [Waterburya sp.]